MLKSSIPAKFNIPFANAAGASYIETIPEASQIGITDGRASLTDGFPPLNFTPAGSGGVPPKGQDFNGILKQITQWNQWQQAGGAVPYDSAFQTAIGGYPINAVVASATTDGKLWMSTIDGNTANPDTGGAGWIIYFNGLGGGNYQPVVNLSGASTLAATTVNSFYELNGSTTFVTTLPAPTGLSGARYKFFNVSSANQTISTPSGSFVGFGTNSTANQTIPPGDHQEFVSDGTSWVSTNMNLNNFPNSFSTSGYQKLPSGLITQWGSTSITAGVNTNQAVNLPITFPTAPIGVSASCVSTGSYGGAVTYNNTQLYVWANNTSAVVNWIIIGH